MYSLDIPINRYMCYIFCILENYKYAQVAARRGNAPLVADVSVYTIFRSMYNNEL